VRPDGRREVIVGATSDEREDDHLTRAGDVFGLLRDVRALLPEVDDAVLLEAVTRSRPGSPDNAPILGWAADGLFLATGHHRNGILLTPLTAAAVDQALGAPPGGADAVAAVEATTRFADPRRFADADSTTRGGTA
jgi:glycine oxidase